MAKKEKEEEKEEKEEPASPAEEGDGEEGEEGEEGEGGGSSKKKKMILIAGVVLVVLGITAAVLVFTGVLGGHSKEDAAEQDGLAPIPKIVYFDLEEFLVNLNNPGKQTSFLKIAVTLELPNLRAKEIIEAKLPRIRDSFQVYLRELRSADLQGSAGIQRLREELLLRVNKIMDPEKINDILFKEMIVQ